MLAGDIIIYYYYIFPLLLNLFIPALLPIIYFKDSSNSTFGVILYFGVPLRLELFSNAVLLLIEVYLFSNSLTVVDRLLQPSGCPPPNCILVLRLLFSWISFFISSVYCIILWCNSCTNSSVFSLFESFITYWYTFRRLVSSFFSFIQLLNSF